MSRFSVIVKDWSSVTKPVGYGKFIGSCAALPQHFGCHRTSTWRAGAIVKGNTKIAKGTCIATFKNGKYPNESTGNHAAIYVSLDLDGITVFDQWKGRTPGLRLIPFLDGMGDPSNNGNCFSVILTPAFTKAAGYEHSELASNPAMPSESSRLLSQVQDESIKKSLAKALKNELLTYNEIVAIIRSAWSDKNKKGRRYNKFEIQDIQMILNNAITLDQKSLALLQRFVKNPRSVTF